MPAVFLIDTTSNEKRADFEAAFKNNPDVIFLHTHTLTSLQFPQADEITGTTAGNLHQKQNGTAGHLRQLLARAPWLFYAEVAVTRGWVAPETAAAMFVWRQYGLELQDVAPDLSGPSLTNADLFEILTDEATANGCGESWQTLRTAPVYLLNDDSKSSLSFVSSTGNSTPLTFGFLQTALQQAAPDSPLWQLHKAIANVAAYMMVAQTATGLADDAILNKDGTLSDEDAWAWYLDHHPDEPLFGPDGSSIIDLLGPHETVRSLEALATAAAPLGQLDDLVVSSTSCVAAARMDMPGTPLMAEATASYRLRPKAQITALIAAGGKIHLSDIFQIAAPDGPTSVYEWQSVRTRTSPKLLAREMALAKLTRQLEASGVISPLADRHLPPSAIFRPYDSRDSIALVVPPQTSADDRESFARAVTAAWGGQVTVICYDLDKAVHDPETARAIQTCAAVCMIDPALVQNPSAPQFARNVHDFLMLGLNREIDGTVGYPVWSGNPTLIVGDLTVPNSGAERLHTLIAGLHIHGRTKNPAQHLFTRLDDLPKTIAAYQHTTVVRPANSATPPVAETCPLKRDANIIPPTERPLVVALYGGAKPLARQQDVICAHRVMETVIRSQATGEQSVLLEGQDLRQVGKWLGILPPHTPYTSCHQDWPQYLQRLDTALRMMPGTRVERVVDGVSDTPVYRLSVPVVVRPVIFVHGGGTHPYEPILSHAPTNNVMGTFAGGAHLALLDGKLAFVSTHGISTTALMRLEGRVDAIPRTNSFAVVAGGTIAERTHATQNPFSDDHHPAYAISTIGSSGIGTAQESLSFPGHLILVTPPDDPVAGHILTERSAIGYPTTVVQNHDTSGFAEHLARALPNDAHSLSHDASAPRDWNRLYPVFTVSLSNGR